MTNNVATIRRYKGLSQTELARRAGISRQSLIKIENGNTEDPHLKASKNLAKELGVSVEQLFFAQNVHLDLQK